MNQCWTVPHGQKMAPAHVSGLEPGRLGIFPIIAGRPITSRYYRSENGSLIHSPGSGSERLKLKCRCHCLYTSSISAQNFPPQSYVLIRALSSGAIFYNIRDDKSFIQDLIVTATIPVSGKETLYPLSVHSPKRSGSRCASRCGASTASTKNTPYIIMACCLRGRKSPSPQKKSSHDLGLT